ncbi:hypothetical protein IGB42_04141 [Andreprevotia sp. IGB-42]|uniref:helix-turn-helix domain-containing protein n=1 Tax=Andreprevotia sp. IGB-42 TaxID=2497473 RepID=UPI001359C943|nr:helix-turn-helix transcriptional regulator [Andreprevotia sp. IGB-42]KAF0811375.1 hypothetical protein IGB42_04141 [Andreprevotia sp. IGB-42]
MKKSTTASLLPSVAAPLLALGQHIRSARQARGWTIAEAAARVVVSTATYKRIEAGDPSVSMASWANTLCQLQLLDAVIGAAAPAQDALGEGLRAAQASKRIRKAKVKDDYDF